MGAKIARFFSNEVDEAMRLLEEENEQYERSNGTLRGELDSLRGLIREMKEGQVQDLAAYKERYERLIQTLTKENKELRERIEQLEQQVRDCIEANRNMQIQHQQTIATMEARNRKVVQTGKK